QYPRKRVLKVQLAQPLSMAGAGFRPRSAKWLNARPRVTGQDRNLSEQAGSGPVAERRLHQRQRRHCRGVVTQHPGPQRKPQGSRLSQQESALFLGKSTFGADQDVDPVRSRRVALQRLQWICGIRSLVAENKQALSL